MNFTPNSPVNSPNLLYSVFPCLMMTTIGPVSLSWTLGFRLFEAGTGADSGTTVKKKKRKMERKRGKKVFKINLRKKGTKRSSNEYGGVIRHFIMVIFVLCLGR